MGLVVTLGVLEGTWHLSTIGYLLVLTLLYPAVVPRRLRPLWLRRPTAERHVPSGPRVQDLDRCR